MNKWMFLILIIMALFLVGCFHSDEEQPDAAGVLVECLGASSIKTIKTSTKVTVEELKPDYATGTPATMTKRVLTQQEVLALRKLLLNENHYILDFKKKAVFIPNLGFRFEGKKEVRVIVSFSARQIVFIKNDKEINLDYDRMTVPFENFCKQLIGENHE